ncbi:MAG: ISAzo13 family transposase [Gammaproteobacteria bacterium]
MSSQPGLSPTAEQIAELRFAASKMHGAERRAFVAQIALKYCDGNARQTEQVFGWGREMVETGLGEKRTGIVCMGAKANFSGNQRWEEKHPEVAADLRRLAEEHAQQDPSFRSTIAFTRLTAAQALRQLRALGHKDEDLPAPGTMAKILKRLGYRLRRVLKAKPLKKIPQTDAIFGNVKEKDEANKALGAKRISVDCKATVKLGDLSRGGMTRGDHRACDHDMQCTGKHTPCGILDEDAGQVHIEFGSSAKTSDFIVDSLQAWWKVLPFEKQQAIPLIQIKMDNGPESSGVRTQFLQRIVEWADQITKPIHLLYFPPYHSKYNPIERCWGILEQHWNGAKLVDIETMLAWAGSMTWKGLHPIVQLSKSVYEKGVSLTKKAMKAIESRLHRNPDLPKWDILIRPV